MKNQLHFTRFPFILLLLLTGTLLSAKAQSTLSKYQIVYEQGMYKGEKMAVIRSFTRERTNYRLAVGLSSLRIYPLPADAFPHSPCTWTDILKQNKRSPYVKAIQAAQKRSLALQDAGIQQGYAGDKGIVLTIDLCPSHKALDRVIFTSLIQEFKKTVLPVPVGLSITGKFLEAHADDIQWLLQLEKAGDLQLLWIDHTYNHRYDPKLPLNNNFLLEKGTNIREEVLLLEQALLQRNMEVSPFFRFPGLVSDQAVVDSILSFGLIPIGSDAWIAKGQKARNGNIVLIHGNGNEPLGVIEFIELLRKEQGQASKKQWQLYDLRQNVEEEFNAR